MGLNVGGKTPEPLIQIESFWARPASRPEIIRPTRINIASSTSMRTSIFIGTLVAIVIVVCVSILLLSSDPESPADIPAGEDLEVASSSGHPPDSDSEIPRIESEGFEETFNTKSFRFVPKLSSLKGEDAQHPLPLWLPMKVVSDRGLILKKLEPTRTGERTFAVEARTHRVIIEPQGCETLEVVIPDSVADPVVDLGTLRFVPRSTLSVRIINGASTPGIGFSIIVGALLREGEGPPRDVVRSIPCMLRNGQHQIEIPVPAGFWASVSLNPKDCRAGVTIGPSMLRRLMTVDGETHEILLDLQQQQSISGALVEIPGRSERGRTIILTYSSVGGVPRRVTLTAGVDGVFSVLNLPPSNDAMLSLLSSPFYIRLGASDGSTVLDLREKPDIQVSPVDGVFGIRLVTDKPLTAEKFSIAFGEPARGLVRHPQGICVVPASEMHPGRIVSINSSSFGTFEEELPSPLPMEGSVIDIRVPSRVCTVVIASARLDDKKYEAHLVRIVDGAEKGAAEGYRWGPKGKDSGNRTRVFSRVQPGRYSVWVTYGVGIGKWYRRLDGIIKVQESNELVEVDIPEVRWLVGKVTNWKEIPGPHPQFVRIAMASAYLKPDGGFELAAEIPLPVLATFFTLGNPRKLRGQITSSSDSTQIEIECRGSDESFVEVRVAPAQIGFKSGRAGYSAGPIPSQRTNPQDKIAMDVRRYTRVSQEADGSLRIPLGVPESGRFCVVQEWFAKAVSDGQPQNGIFRGWFRLPVTPGVHEVSMDGRWVTLHCSAPVGRVEVVLSGRTIEGWSPVPVMVCTLNMANDQKLWIPNGTTGISLRQREENSVRTRIVATAAIRDEMNRVEFRQ